VILKLLDQIAYRKGFGAVLSNGTRKAAQEIGRGSEYYAKHIKGLDAEGDIRMSYGTALSFSVSTRGSDHLQGMPIIEFYDLDYLPEKARDGFMKKIGSIHKPDTRKPEAAPALVAYYNPQMAVFNSLELCQNVTDWVLFYAIRLEDMPPLLAATTNIEFNEKELRSIGRRIRAVQRAFNARLGIRRDDDIPPDFFFERPVIRGPLPAKKFVLKKNDYNKMLDKFYELSEYDIKTGIPTKSTLERLDLADIAEDLTKRGIIPG
jgi:aldehyde:ferredoxin oxidoreductase